MKTPQLSLEANDFILFWIFFCSPQRLMTMCTVAFTLSAQHLFFNSSLAPCVFWNAVPCTSESPHCRPQLKTEEQTNESSCRHTGFACKSAPTDTITTSRKHWNAGTVIFLLGHEWKTGTGGMGSQAWCVMRELLGGLNQADWPEL